MSNKNSNHLVNPSAREAMDKFKMEAASEVGVNLKNGYNGELTSRQAGNILFYLIRDALSIVCFLFLIKNRCPVRQRFIFELWFRPWFELAVFYKEGTFRKSGERPIGKRIGIERIDLSVRI